MLNPYDIDDSTASPQRSTRLWMGRERWERVVEEAQPVNQTARRIYHRRRREPRHPYRVSCLIRLGQDGVMGVYSIDTRDLSTHGIGFQHDRYLPPQTPCLIALRDALSCVTLHSAQVRWCQEIDPAGYDIGVEFDCPIDAQSFITASA